MSLEFSPEEVLAIKSEYCHGASQEQVTLFLAECKRRNLVPGTHLFFQLRSAKVWDSVLEMKVAVNKATWITKIDAMRLIAQRTGQYEGQEPVQYIYLDEHNHPSVVSDIPLPSPANKQIPLEPWAARVSVFRTGFKKPFTATCRFDAYAVTIRTDNGAVLSGMWARRGPEQLAKCTEVAALKGAFPEELGSLYITEEFEKEQASFPDPEAPQTPLVAAPVAPEVPVINHTPAVPTNEPRPGENAEVPKKSRARRPNVEDQPAVAQNPEFQATDDDLPPIMWADDKPKDISPAPLTGKQRAEKVQGYYPLASADLLRKYILKQTGASKSTDITPEHWTVLFADLDAGVAAGKEAFLKLVTDGISA